MTIDQLDFVYKSFIAIMSVLIAYGTYLNAKSRKGSK